MIREGDIVITSYGTGPYVVLEIHGGCRCPDYHTQLDCDGTPCAHERACEEACPLTRDDPPHLHLVCVEEATWRRGTWRQTDLRWLNGYAERRPGHLRCIWRGGQDTLDVIGHVSGVQMALGL